MGCSLPVLHHLHIQAGLVCIFSPAQGRKMMIWIGFKRAEFFLQKKEKKMLSSGMCFDEADVQRSSTFVLYAPKKGDLFNKQKKSSRLDCSVMYVSHLTRCEAQPDASGSTGLVLIHLSYITSCRVAACSTMPVLSKDCVCTCYQSLAALHQLHLLAFVYMHRCTVTA